MVDFFKRFSEAQSAEDLRILALSPDKELTSDLEEVQIWHILDVSPMGDPNEELGTGYTPEEALTDYLKNLSEGKRGGTGNFGKDLQIVVPKLLEEFRTKKFRGVKLQEVQLQEIQKDYAIFIVQPNFGDFEHCDSSDFVDVEIDSYGFYLCLRDYIQESVGMDMNVTHHTGTNEWEIFRKDS